MYHLPIHLRKIVFIAEQKWFAKNLPACREGKAVRTGRAYIEDAPRRAA